MPFITLKAKAGSHRPIYLNTTCIEGIVRSLDDTCTRVYGTANWVYEVIESQDEVLAMIEAATPKRTTLDDIYDLLVSTQMHPLEVTE